MPPIDVAIANGICQITFNRPKVNALNGELLEQLGQAFEAATADDAIRGILLDAVGSCFSAGLDLKAVATMNRETLVSFMQTFDRSVKAVFGCPKPVAAVVHGHAIAGGLVLAATADFCALGTGDYRLGLTELAVGIPFPHLAFEILRDALPHRAMRRLIYQADAIGPEEAFELGVGDVLTDDPAAAAKNWLELVAPRPAETFAFAKRLKRQAAWERLANIDAGERDAMVDAMLSPEVAEALARTL